MGAYLRPSGRQPGEINTYIVLGADAAVFSLLVTITGAIF